jgi:outer membrane protein TolC
MRRSVLLLLLIIPLGLHAQIKRRALNLPPKIELPDTIKPLVMPYQVAPLDTLIKRAYLYSPLLKSQDALIETQVIARQNEAWDWADMARVFGGASYGNGQLLNNSTDGAGTINTLATRQDVYYSVGINLSLSPYDLLTRKRRLQGLDTEIVRSRIDRITLEERIAEAVLLRYQDLMLAIEMQEIRQQNFQNQQINTELAEGYFEAGDISYAEYNAALESLIKARIDYVTALHMTERAYLLLKSIVGNELF